MDKKVSVVLSLETIKNNLSPNEREPCFNIFFYRLFKGDPVTVGLNAKTVKITAVLPGRYNGKIPQTASIVLSGWALRPNDKNEQCLMDIGTNHLALSKLVDNKNKKIDVPIQMHTVNNYEKAVVRVTVHEVNLGGVEIVNYRFVGDGIVDYVKATFDREKEMKDTIPGTSNMRVPYDYSESGIELTGGVPLPALGYVMSETPVSNHEFWQNDFETVLARDDLDPHEFDRLNIQGKARIMALMVCYVAQYLDYISDTVDRNKLNQTYVAQLVQGCENFGDSLATWSGDCEDLGTGILQTYNSFVSAKFDKTSALFELQSIAKQYISILSLDVVNGAKVSDENAPKGAHMNVNLVPIAEYRKWMRKTPEGRILDEKLAPLYPKKINTELPFMVGEGTGKLEPLGYDNPMLPVMGYVYRLSALSSFKKPIPRSRTDAGQFLLGSLAGFTDYYLRRGLTIGSMWYIQTDSKGDITRGAKYNDMINDRSDVGILMHQPIPRPTMMVMQEATFFRDPPHPLILTKKNKFKADNEHLDYLVRSVREFGNESKAQPHLYVPVYVRAKQVTKSLISGLVAQISGLTHICKVEYRLERITDAIAGYEVRFFIAK